jgi:hypothetical protein
MDQIEISPDELILAYGEVNIQNRMLEKALREKSQKILHLEEQLKFYDDKLWEESVTPLDTD